LTAQGIREESFPAGPRRPKLLGVGAWDRSSGLSHLGHLDNGQGFRNSPVEWITLEGVRAGDIGPLARAGPRKIWSSGQDPRMGT